MNKGNTSAAVRKADFSLGGVQLENRSKSSEPIKKSSYLCPESIQSRLKILAAKRGVKLNDVMIEAMEDILAKYGE